MLFTSEKATYLLTIAFAAIGWTTNQIWLDITSTPTVEAERHIYDSATSNTGFTITNLSRKQSFDNLVFKIVIDNSSNAKCQGQPILMPIAPTDLGYSQDKKRIRPKCESEKYAEYQIQKLHPGGKVKLLIEASNETYPLLLVNSNKPIRLIESSAETYVIKNRFCILVLLFVAWSITVLILLTFGNAKRGTRSER